MLVVGRAGGATLVEFSEERLDVEPQEGAPTLEASELLGRELPEIIPTAKTLNLAFNTVEPRCDSRLHSSRSRGTLQVLQSRLQCTEMIQS